MLIQGQKFLWKLKDIDQTIAHSIAYDFNLSFPIAQTLYARGFLNKEQISSFLFTSFQKNVADSRLFKDIDTAIDRILHAIKKKEKILIFGDYDVDGITSTALLLVALLPLDADINFYLPNRIKDGYGLSEKFVQKASQNNYKLIITVDNGISAFDAADLAQKLNIDLIITDHHRPHGNLPVATAIVNANQDSCMYPYKDFAGVGIIFKIVCLIYKELNKEISDKIYELLMLGTVADVAPLTGENRFWVQYGLCKINKQKSLAINVLAQNSKLNKNYLDSLDIGFSIAPQLNALGRLADPRQAVAFLISSDEREVNRIGRILLTMNEERKEVDRKIYQEIEYAIELKKINLEQENIIIAANSSWPAGVIGLVAGKIVQNYGKPTFLFHLNKNGILKGSCRSIPEFNIFDALQENKDILISFGGHSFAAGLSLRQDDVFVLKENLENKIAKELSPQDLQPKIEVDAELELPELNKQMLFDLQRLEPFGNQNRQPIFLVKNVTLQSKPQLLKDKHLKCLIFADGVIKPIIFFNRPDLYSILNNIGDKFFDVVCNVIKNEWNDKISIELQGLDIRV
ncbi:single-stranded-DNA-specific exonuclease RecJ [Candidatus Babeliales bacterium]|nr:single-stranded-DNA-specific exonuclease RecJ [Candidatus Babeliales bacterium]MCF7899858.1 single-stranded-DNA-specific exonuclease RecJ [Candidatus Babeliales bacterium]